jgi:hypothetical protein
MIVDGQAEFRSIPRVLQRITSPHTLLNPIYADIQPFAPPAQIIRAVESKLPILRNKHVQMVLVLIDKETRDVCPGLWATQLTTQLNHQCARGGINSLSIIIKNQSYENWLVSDTSVFGRMPRRFKLNAKQLRAITPNKADQVNAYRILSDSAIGSSYDKVSDAIQIMSLADPLRIASNSRSFRRFLRQLKHPSYLKQSVRP